MSEEVEITRRRISGGGEEKFDVGVELEALQAKELQTQTRLAALDLSEGCEAFEDKPIRGAKQVLIAQAKRIIEEYRARDFRLTLRQLFYQFVARGLLLNEQREYDRLGAAVSDGRNLGLIPWDRIEDRTRFLRELRSWSDPAESMRDAAERYREDLWLGQGWRPEVWIEKDALVGVIEGICEQYRVPHFSCRGYCSDSALYEAAQRLRACGATPIILHLGDHDASGLQMTGDIQDKMRKFNRGVGIEVKRLALNEDQIDEFNPPPNVVKDSDSRSAAYKEEHGSECWELDALDPAVIADLIRRELDQMIDRESWAAAERKEEENRQRLLRLAEGMSEDIR